MRAIFALVMVASLAARGGDDPDFDQARQHFRLAERHYAEGRYAEAIVEFEAAYRVRPHGALHFNIAKCHERLGNTDQAVAGYRAYLREVPDASDRELVARTLTELEARLPAGESAARVAPDAPVVSAPGLISPTSPPAAQAGSSPSTTAHSDVVRDTGSSNRRWTWIAAAAAGVSTGTGMAFGVSAVGARDELRRTFHSQSTAQQLHDAAAGRAGVANVAYGTAAVAAVTAIILYVVEPGWSASKSTSQPPPAVLEKQP